MVKGSAKHFDKTNTFPWDQKLIFNTVFFVTEFFETDDWKKSTVCCMSWKIQSNFKRDNFTASHLLGQTSTAFTWWCRQRGSLISSLGRNQILATTFWPWVNTYLFFTPKSGDMRGYFKSFWFYKTLKLCVEYNNVVHM